jgi:hypothetical protein
MRIITTKTDQAIRNEFGRRGFLKLAGSAGFGVIVYSQTGPISLAVGPHNMRPGVNLRSFFAGFGEFALNVGLDYLGGQVSEWLYKYPKWRDAVQSFARGLRNTYSLYNDYKVIGDQRTIFFPMYNQQNGLTMSPFFGQNDHNLGSEISMVTGLALPTVNRELASQYTQKQRAAFLIPRQPQNGSYNNMALPERYGTDSGSAEFRGFKGGARGGEVPYTVWVRRGKGTLEQRLKEGMVFVDIER